MEVDKAETEAEPASASSNEESDDDADADADVEESPRGRKSVSSIIAEMAIKNEQEAASSSVRTQKEDEQKRLGECESKAESMHSTASSNVPLPPQSCPIYRQRQWPPTYVSWKRSSTS